MNWDEPFVGWRKWAFAFALLVWMFLLFGMVLDGLGVWDWGLGPK